VAAASCSAPGVDAVSAMMSLHYAFESEMAASRVLKAVCQLLRPGGVFFGVAPCADAVLSRIRGRDAGGGDRGKRGGGPVDANTYAFGPPQHPFALRLHLIGGVDATASADYGQVLLFSLQDSVLADAESDGCTEFLLHRSTLTRLASQHGLRPLKVGSMLDAVPSGGPPGSALGESERIVASLYFVFAFEKTSSQ